MVNKGNTEKDSNLTENMDNPLGYTNSNMKLAVIFVLGI